MVRIYSGLDVTTDQGGQFPWKSRLIDVGGGVKQAVVDEGPRNARLTFLLLHGNPTWGFLYRRFIARLSKSHRVIVVDHVGFGRSDKPRDPKYYTLERHIQNLETVLNGLKVDHVVPVMQDWGGPIGMGWATRHPDKVAGAVVLNTWCFVTENGGFRLPWLFKFLILGKGGWKRATQKNLFTELFLGKGGPRKLTKEELDPYRAPHPMPEDRIGIARFPQMIPEIGATNHESYATMLAIEQNVAKLSDRPALLVWAMKDRGFKKPQLERWKTVFKNLDGPHRLPNAGHYSQEDEPDAILAHIDRWVEGQLWSAKKGARKTVVVAAAR